MQAELAVRAKAKFSTFCKGAWDVLEPSTPLEWNWHLDAITDHIQAVLEGWMNVMLARHHRLPDPPQAIQNLVINIPPGTGKSRFTSVFAPAWMWLRWPSWRAIFISGNPRVALRDADLCRTLIESQWYRERFRPDWKLAKDQNAKSLYRNTAGGSRMAISAGSKVTGDRADALFVDDPNDAAETMSETIREGVNDWWDQGAGNRVNDLRCSTRILIQQRLHERDLTGHATDTWAKLIIPQEFEPSRIIESPIGWKDPRTEDGELMHAARFTPVVIQAEKARLGPTGYAGQHQQRPSAAGGSLFKSVWFKEKFVDLNQVPKLLRICRGWDLAATEEKRGNDPDWTAGVKIGITPDGRYFIMDARRKRANPLGTEQFVGTTAAMDGRPVGHRLEQEPGSSGKVVLTHYLNNVLRGYSASGAPSTGDKITRAAPFSSACERGVVYMVRGDWNGDYLAELESFPRGAHDDQVDASSRAFEGLQNAAETATISTSMFGVYGKK